METRRHGGPYHKYPEKQTPQKYLQGCQSGGITRETPTGEPRNNRNANFNPIKYIHQCITYEGEGSVDITRGTPTSSPRKNPIKNFNQAKIQQLHQEKGKSTKNYNWNNKSDTEKPQTHVIPEVEKPPKSDIILERNGTHKYKNRSSTKRVKNMTTFKNPPNIFKMDAAEKMETHIGTDYFARIDTKN